MNPRLRILAITASLFVIVCSTATAETILVRQDGSGDFDSVGGAVAAATAGDHILIGPGTYEENIVVDFDLAFEAETTADSTILDGGNAHRIMIIQSGATVSIEGLAFTRANDPGDSAHGAAIFIWQGSRVDIVDCEFRDNFAGWDNGALHARGTGTDVTVTGTTFADNSAIHNGGACGVAYSGALTVERCVFRGNSCNTITGALNAYNASSLNVYDCLFEDNLASTGAILVEQSSADIVGNTFYRNSSFEHASVVFYTGGTGTFSQNIVSGDLGGAGLRLLDGGACSHGCNLYDGNAGGAVMGDTVQPDELVVPALFCDPDGGDFTLCANSPALEVNNICGLMGAFGEGCGECGVIAVEERSWSQVKDIYR